MLRSLLILSVLVASSYTVSGQYTTERRYFDDFRGQKFCATRYGTGQCCRDRLDECSVPIAGTLCYCDEFCDQHINPDCCPDYEPVCKGLAPKPDDIHECEINGQRVAPGEKVKVDDCNSCWCTIDGESNRPIKYCETDTCLNDRSMISDVNNDASRLGWKAGSYNQFEGYKLQQGFDLRLGTFYPRIKVKSMSRLGHKNENLPKTYNSFEITSFSGIRDQGWCNSSWAVSTASVSSDRLGKKGEEFINISAQHLLSCTPKQKGCSGGHLDNAWRFLNRIGVADEDCYPYEEQVGRCRAKKGDNLSSMQCRSRSDGRNALYKMGPAYSLNNETDIMWEIFHYGPVQATMWVYQDFFVYNKGIYRKSQFVDESAKGFHSVRLMGWGEEAFNGRTEKFWLATNSWGDWWGERGFFRILRGTNECEIESYVLAAMADHDRKINGRQVRRANRRVHRKSN